MKKEILLGMLLAGQAAPTFSDGVNNQNNKRQEIFENFEGKNKFENTYQLSSNKLLEILQNNIKEQIIQGTIIYFERDVTFTLTNGEKEQLKNDLTNYLNNNPNIIRITGNQIYLNLNDDNFTELFKVLLPYLGRGRELSQYPSLIRNNSSLILNHINKSKGSDAEKYFFHQFGYLIMRIVEQMPGDMTIGYYRGEMLKVIPNKYITNKEYPTNLLNSSIRELPRYF